MHILLDEDLPRRLAALLVGHEVSTVQRSGWTGIKNGELLKLAAADFDVFVSMDRNLEFQQNISALPIAVLLVRATSNRMEHLTPLIPRIMQELNHIQPRRFGRSAYSRAFFIGRARRHGRSQRACVARRSTRALTHLLISAVV